MIDLSKANQDLTAENVVLRERIRKLETTEAERRQAEEALRDSERLYRSLIECSSDAIFCVNEKGQYHFVNKLFAKTFNKSPDYFKKKTFWDIYPKEHADYRYATTQRVIQTGESKSIEVEVPLPDKTLFFYATANPIKDETGKVVLVLTNAVDITDRKEMERVLKESEERFRLAYATSPDAININRISDGLYIDINEGFTKLTGFTREDVIGRTSLEINIWHNPEDRQTLVKGLKEKGYFDNLEAQFRRKDGSLTTALMSAKILTLQNSPHIISITRDISERKRSEEERERLHEQLAQAQKMESVGRLAGGVAHDFNNMLGVILGHTEMAIDRVGTDKALRADLMEIHRAASRSSDLTRQLLAFARKQTIVPRVLDLNETVTGMLKMLQRLIGEDIDLAWKPGEELWTVKMDPTQIDQVLANLCVNARDAIADVGKITIETNNKEFDEEYCSRNAGFTPGSYVLLAVSDDGCGMDAETLHHLFEPFFTTKEMGKGTGLGLATVYGAVKQNNGFLNVYSEPGRGTTFKIYLPRYASKQELLDNRTSIAAVTHGSETILLVEDEPAMMRMITKMLEKLGYAVLTARTPGEAIRIAGEHFGRIDLLMTDVVLPEMNGRDLAKNLLSVYPDIKRLFMSGYTANVIAHHGVLDPGVHFIQKPFLTKDLAAKLREALEE